MISDKTIEGVLNENVSVQHKALRLVELANEAGGYDNITVQLIQNLLRQLPQLPLLQTPWHPPKPKRKPPEQMYLMQPKIRR
jgi:serine/threonine protein phosphatase PrpC